jgi:transcriptional regulator with XRE-family HTH domain
MNLQDVSKRYGKATGKKQYEIAEDLGISASFWSQIKSNKRNIDPDLAEKIEKYFSGEITFKDILMPAQEQAVPKDKVRTSVVMQRGGILRPETRRAVMEGMHAVQEHRMA